MPPLTPAQAFAARQLIIDLIAEREARPLISGANWREFHGATAKPMAPPTKLTDVSALQHSRHLAPSREAIRDQ